MTTIIEDQLAFIFPDNFHVIKWDGSDHHKTFQNCCNLQNNDKDKNKKDADKKDDVKKDPDKGSKAVDIVAIYESILWLIEIKDYSREQLLNEKLSDFPYIIARKIRDSLAGLVSAKFKAKSQEEKDFAHLALNCNEIKIVLHVEMPSISKLSPSSSDLASLLKNKFKTSEFTISFEDCYAKPIFTDITHTNNEQQSDVPWSVSAIGTNQ